jgi:hypothetical protein
MIKCKSIPIKDVEKMLKLIDLQLDTGKEHGMLLCKNGDKIVTSDSCRGAKCGIIPKKFERLSCPKGTKEIGEYHTHPNLEYELPSIGDIKVSATKNHKLFCIGKGKRSDTKHHKLIHCYNIKNRELKRLGKEYAKADEEKRKEISRSMDLMMSGKAIVNDLLNERCMFEDIRDPISPPSIILEEDGITIEYENGKAKAYKIDLIKMEKIPANINR